MKRLRKLVRVVLVLTPVCFILASYYIKSHPLVFNESRWTAFAEKQVDMLVEAGFTREQAQHLYGEAK